MHAAAAGRAALARLRRAHGDPLALLRRVARHRRRLSFRFNDGTRAIMSIHDEDALRTIILHEQT